MPFFLHISCSVYHVRDAVRFSEPVEVRESDSGHLLEVYPGRVIVGKGQELQIALCRACYTCGLCVNNKEIHQDQQERGEEKEE